MRDQKQLAREIFSYALEQNSVSAAFDKHVAYERGVLRVCDDLYQLSSYAAVLVIALGKAAHNMVEALTERVGLHAQGIVAAPEAAFEGRSHVAAFRYFAAGHPEPNSESIKAARAALAAISNLPQRSLVIYLISGGGSSLFEQPADAGISLDDLRATYGALVHCGAPIVEINAIRKHLSAVKGGRLAREVDSASPFSQQVSIMISDVPEDSLDALASGPTMPDASTAEECYEIFARYLMGTPLPVFVQSLFRSRALDETPKKDDTCFRNSRWWPLLSNRDVLKTAAVKATENGYAVEIDNSCDDWDYRRAADHLLEKVRRLRRGASRVCLLSGGETSVKVPAAPGIGGRNQQFALYCACKIAGENLTVVSAGTDGIDGNSVAAGAVVDGATLRRFSLLGTGRPLSSFLDQFDSFCVFDKLGDALITGPTGNNLRDLRILLAD